MASIHLYVRGSGTVSNEAGQAIADAVAELAAATEAAGLDARIACDFTLDLEAGVVSPVPLEEATPEEPEAKPKAASRKKK